MPIPPRFRIPGWCMGVLLALGLALAAGQAVADSAPRVAVVAFGLYGDLGVFQREASGAARIVASRVGSGAGLLVRANTKRGGSATVAGLSGALRDVARRMNPQTDVLFLVLTSHGSPEGLAIKAGRQEDTLTPAVLAAILDRTGIRHRVVVVSACFSGVFVPALANADSIVITAADSSHTSFGCQDEASWTYFGDAFFNQAMRRAGSIPQAFQQASAIVRARELSNGFQPSNPQIAVGDGMASLSLH